MSDEMSDADFIGYCEIHSKSERALFCRRDVNRLLELAGMQADEWREWVSWHYGDMKAILKRAKLKGGK